MLDDIYFGGGVECAPGLHSTRHYMKDGERQIGEMTPVKRKLRREELHTACSKSPRQRYYGARARTNDQQCGDGYSNPH